ncbi:hypothetical protein [Kitasatospora aureofaciens]|uniref:hypothetical protein n=1 Tax=Kitasatospora aureofaciens TaxID=1894 RepID=UPI0036F46775
MPEWIALTCAFGLGALPKPSKWELVAALVSVPDDPWWEARVLHAKLYPAPLVLRCCVAPGVPGHLADDLKNE